jgi:hypothetical protein
MYLRNFILFWVHECEFRYDEFLYYNEVFYDTQYDPYDQLKKDSYGIEKDPHVKIRRLWLILYDWFFKLSYGSIQRSYG